MGDKAKSKVSSHLQPKPNPPPKPKMFTNEVRMTRTLEDLTAKYAHLEEKTSLLYVDMHKKNDELSNEISHLHAQFTSLREDHSQLQRDHTLLRDNHSQLQKDHEQRQPSVSKLRDSQSVLEEDCAALKVYLDAFNVDHDEIISDQNRLREEQEKMKAEMMQGTSPSCQTKPPRGAEPPYVEIEEIVCKVDGLVLQMSQLQSDCSLCAADVEKLQAYRNQSEADFDNPRRDRDQSEAGVYFHSWADFNAEFRCPPADCNVLEDDNEYAAYNNMPQADDNQSEADVNNPQADVIASAVCSNMPQADDNHHSAADVSRLQALCLELQNVRGHVQNIDGQLAILNDMHKEVGTNTEDIAMLKTTLAKASRLFHACVLNREQSKHYRAMVFDKVTFNEGQHYNEETGVFTAPCAGIYIFTASVKRRMSFDDNACAHSAIMADDTVVSVVRGDFYGGSPASPYS